MKDSISKYIKEAKRLGRQMKQALALTITEGKKPMSKSFYNFISRLLMESAAKERVFAHLFFVLDW